MKPVPRAFSAFARASAAAVGTWQAFTAATAVIVIWALAGFHFGFDNQLYQLLINTVTTIITFLMVFLLQHTQNRDTQAIQLKLDELIAADERAHNRMLALDQLTDDQLQALQKRFDGLARKAANTPGPEDESWFAQLRPSRRRPSPPTAD